MNIWVLGTPAHSPNLVTNKMESYAKVQMQVLNILIEGSYQTVANVVAPKKKKKNA